MIYGYIRVSTDKQDTENQKFEIQGFATKNNLIIDNWIAETISGTKEVDKRKLGQLLKDIQKDDLIICSELSRLGRSLFMIMDVLNILMKKEAKVWTIKDNYRLGDDIQSKVLAFAFGLSAEIERNLISQRTKEALKKKMAEGIMVGRPKGCRSQCKLQDQQDKVKELLQQGLSYQKISNFLGVHRYTLYRFVEKYNLIQYRKNKYPLQKRSKFYKKTILTEVKSKEWREYIDAGLDYTEMGKKLCVHPSTVRNHFFFHKILDRLYKKKQDEIRIIKNGCLNRKIARGRQNG